MADELVVDVGAARVAAAQVQQVVGRCAPPALAEVPAALPGSASGRAVEALLGWLEQVRALVAAAGAHAAAAAAAAEQLVEVDRRLGGGAGR